MSEQMDKLVNELGKILYGLDGIRPSLPKGRAIEQAIIRIGKAYGGGELKIPGEVIREKLRGAEHPWGIGLKVGDILIALRKEEDMPKELLEEITKGQRP